VFYGCVLELPFTIQTGTSLFIYPQGRGEKERAKRRGEEEEEGRRIKERSN